MFRGWLSEMFCHSALLAFVAEHCSLSISEPGKNLLERLCTLRLREVRRWWRMLMPRHMRTLSTMRIATGARPVVVRG